MRHKKLKGSSGSFSEFCHASVTYYFAKRRFLKLSIGNSLFVYWRCLLLNLVNKSFVLNPISAVYCKEKTGKNHETYFQTWKGRLCEMTPQKGGIHTYTLSSASQILKYFEFFVNISKHKKNRVAEQPKYRKNAWLLTLKPFPEVNKNKSTNIFEVNVTSSYYLLIAKEINPKKLTQKL